MKRISPALEFRDCSKQGDALPLQSSVGRPCFAQGSWAHQYRDDKDTLQHDTFSFQLVEGRGRASTPLPSTSEQLEGGNLSTRRSCWELVIAAEDNLGSRNTLPLFSAVWHRYRWTEHLWFGVFSHRTGHQHWYEFLRRITPCKV